MAAESDSPESAKSARVRELEALLGRTVAGRYEITRLIGLGGMGAVYEAEHVGIGKKVAIKFIDEEHARIEEVSSRFAREARAASKIESEHIVTVFDAGTEDERPFLVMELLRGEDLGRRLKRRGKLPLGESLHVVTQVLHGLADAHEAGIVHRDLKPDNVFLTTKKGDDSFVKIVDFGISKIAKPGVTTAPLAVTRAGTVLGTPLYMSPEQAQAAADLDARADLYSVGAILFECLAGRPPHVGETYEQIIVSICMNDAPDVRSIAPGVPVEISRVVAKALARDRRDRYASARDMLEALADPGKEAASTSRDPITTKASTTLVAGGGVGSLDTPAPVARTDVSWSSGSREKVAVGETPAPASQRFRMMPVVITGLVATLAGAGITVWGVHAMRAKAAPDVAAVGESIGATNVASTSSATATAAPTPTPTPTPASTPTPTSTPTSTPTPTPTPTSSASAPKKKAGASPTAAPKSDGLDLQRDFH